MASKKWDKISGCLVQVVMSGSIVVAASAEMAEDKIVLNGPKILELDLNTEGPPKLIRTSMRIIPMSSVGCIDIIHIPEMDGHSKKAFELISGVVLPDTKTE